MSVHADANEKARINKIGAVLLEHAPNGVAQEVVNKMLRNPVTREIDVVSALYDGLAYGNWFWNGKIF